MRPGAFEMTSADDGTPTATVRNRTGRRFAGAVRWNQTTLLTAANMPDLSPTAKTVGSIYPELYKSLSTGVPTR